MNPDKIRAKAGNITEKETKTIENKIIKDEITKK